MSENRNYIIAIVLSVLVLFGWQFFIVRPNQSDLQEGSPQAEVAATTGATAPDVAVPGVETPAAVALTRADAVAANPRIAIDTPEIAGSVNLTGGRIDDIRLKSFQETTDEDSPIITLFSPLGSPAPYYADFGWVAPPGADPAVPGVAVPDARTVWSAPEGAVLTPQTPLTLTWDNGAGYVFTRTIAVDENYMFAVTDSVQNNSDSAATLYPYALVSRHGTPASEGTYILHEGMIGVFGDEAVRVDYDDLRDDGTARYDQATGGWIGITDKYWAATVIPGSTQAFQPRFTYGTVNGLETFQADYLSDPVTVAPGASASNTARLFAGAKEVSVLDAYEDQYAIPKFDLLIDWGMFYFLTRPMFWVIDNLFQIFGNFGLAILAVTVIVKIIFFPLANKSYVSMSKMKKIGPLMTEVRERYKDDPARQQQEVMALYKREKVNPLAGCLPTLVQIPVFFSLYKVLYTTIEMRHAPFFGWIHDLSAPDPTSVFNLFGLIPWEPPALLMIGVWPIVMGFTQWMQMKLNPTPPDRTQAMIFNWLPVIFTFMLAKFPAGLVIYWAWNNLLSVLQQSFIMRRQGVKIELWSNIRNTFRRKKPATAKT